MSQTRILSKTPENTQPSARRILRIMAVRTKRLAKFEYHGRQFVWWVDSDIFLRIASADKQFVVAYVLVETESIGPLLAVHGPEFLSVSRSERRPVWLAPPRFSADSMGRLVADALDWCFESQNHKRFVGTLPRHLLPRDAGMSPAINEGNIR
jgi:hypothetical protein